MTGTSEKGIHYVSLLDDARVNASWHEFPELIRKVKKHAPQRKVLIATATAEHDVATASGSQSTSLATLSSVLQSANESGNVEEVFQGKTCLLWGRWVGSEGSSMASGFDIAIATRELPENNIALWTSICIIKSAYMEGSIYMKNDNVPEAQKIFNLALPYMQMDRTPTMSNPQLVYWSEQLLAQLALMSTTSAGSNEINLSQIELLKHWGAIATKTKAVPPSTYRNSAIHRSRLAVWKRYYDYLSNAISNQSDLSSTMSESTRTQWCTEIRKVERAYENELLSITKFPSANETNTTVEQWVEQAVRNWQALCGPGWSDVELGEGGKNAVARNMLDILYRAAAKTSHSTLILRRLFQVHLSLSEFDLAYRSFDTYIELVERGRIRSAKSKISEPGQESNAAVLLTISEAIFGLCKFGRQVEARKSYELCLKLEEWLANLGFEDYDADEEGDNIQNVHENGASAETILDPELLQTVYRAIGTSKAHWARWTPVSEKRSDLQRAGLAGLKKACLLGEPKIETFYTTSLLLAETRNINGAIQVAKKALAQNTSSTGQSKGWVTERKLVSQWHLLALLLSSRQDFDSATKSCVAAFEQFATSDLHLEPGRNLSISSDIEKQFRSAVSNFAAEMECDELQRIIEVRITELALIELCDGPEEAVNCSNELLSLFSRLFAHSQISPETSTINRSAMPPKSSAGTIKSSRFSTFGRKRHDASDVPSSGKSIETASTTTNTTRPSTRAAQAPTIQVTHEYSRAKDKTAQLRTSHESSHSKATTDGNHRTLSLRAGHEHRQKQVRLGLENHGANLEADNTGEQLAPLPDEEPIQTPAIPLSHETSRYDQQGLPDVRHNLGAHDSVLPPVSHDAQPPQQDIPSSTVHPFANATSPSPRFPKSAVQKQALTILTKVWLVIATLYRRANMFEDSKEACEEAGKAATKVETLVGAVNQSARAFAEADWGSGNKSSDEVWADVCCERAELQLAIYRQTTKESTQSSQEDLHAALDHYEQCLMFMPNHPGGIVGLSNLLLDSYEKKVDLGRRVNDGRLHHTEPGPIPSVVITNETTKQPVNGHASHPPPTDHTKTDEDLKKSPENLNRIAARDRAYGLLSTLTKLGTGWDDSAAWFALARAHELGGEIDKAKSILWWCVELEDTKPIRHWRNLGYSL